MLQEFLLLDGRHPLESVHGGAIFDTFPAPTASLSSPLVLLPDLYRKGRREVQSMQRSRDDGNDAMRVKNEKRNGHFVLTSVVEHLQQ